MSTTCPWGAWYYGRGAKEGEPSPFKFTFLFSFGTNEMGMSHIAAWDQVTTNKQIAGLWPNDADGEDHRRLIPYFEESGYTVIDGGPYQNGTNDFSAQIAKFKSEGCEIVTAVPIPPDAATFLRQSAQQGFNPKVVQFQKATHQEAVIEGLGALGENLLTGFYWAPNWPYASSLTGISNKDLSDGWTQSSGKPYQCQLGASLALLDVGVAARKASGNPKDKVAVAEAMKTLSVDTSLGKLEWGKGRWPPSSRPRSRTASGSRGRSLPTSGSASKTSRSRRSRSKPSLCRACRQPPMTDESPLLFAQGVSKRFGALTILDSVDFAVGTDDAIGIVGPNGAGKTTLLNILAGLPSRGVRCGSGVTTSRPSALTAGAAGASGGRTKSPGPSVS